MDPCPARREWTVSEDGQDLNVLKLVKGVTWHDGQAVPNHADYVLDRF